jgi:hypothetical protein
VTRQVLSTAKKTPSVEVFRPVIVLELQCDREGEALP